ncbi:MAG: hypothetical protein FWH57_10105 [Oscillospiraceae bacterium]|nr:hypothetical protein [Oscillospiraceae bacterium]
MKKRKRSNESKGFIALGISIIVIFSFLAVDGVSLVTEEVKTGISTVGEGIIGFAFFFLIPIASGIGALVHGIRCDWVPKRERVFIFSAQNLMYLTFGIIIVLFLGCMFYVGVTNIENGGIVFAALAGLIIYGIVNSLTNSSKDEKEGIFRVRNSYDMKKKSEKEMSIRSKYQDPKCEACQRELREFEKSIVYGDRK